MFAIVFETISISFVYIDVYIGSVVHLVYWTNM